MQHYQIRNHLLLLMLAMTLKIEKIVLRKKKHQMCQAQWIESKIIRIYQLSAKEWTIFAKSLVQCWGVQRMRERACGSLQECWRTLRSVLIKKSPLNSYLWIIREMISRTSPRFALIRSWGRASLCTDSAQCGRQEVYGVENNIK